MKRSFIQRETTATNIRRRRHWWPTTLVGRLFLLLSILLGATVLPLAFIAGSVWIENRFPSDDGKRALLPKAQRVVTKPIVDALSRQVEGYVRRHAEAAYMNTGLTLEETIARFLDERVSLAERRTYAYRLARVGSPECVAALLKVLQTAPPEHKAFMAQLIGSAGNSAAKNWLTPLFDDANELVVAGAIRGLSALGGEDVTARIAQILADGACSETIRVEAALGLGTIGTPAASEVLIESFHQTTSSELATLDPVAGVTVNQFPPVKVLAVAVQVMAPWPVFRIPMVCGGTAATPETPVNRSPLWLTRIVCVWPRTESVTGTFTLCPVVALLTVTTPE